MPGGGTEVPIGLSGSTSSGASQSGAVGITTGSNFGGANYGPGSLLLTDQAGSIGASGVGSSGLSQVLLIGGLIAAGVFVLKKLL